MSNRPYYKDAYCTIYCGDAREILEEIGPVDTIITDPVWPNAKAKIPGCDRPFDLLREIITACPDACRLILQLGCDSDPRILTGVPIKWPFIRVVSLEYGCPTHKGRLLYTGDVAYVFGQFPKSIPGRRVMPGRFVSTRPDVKRQWVSPHKEYGYGKPSAGEHPCPRRMEHVQYLVGRWVEGIVLDPLMGSGTTLLAAKRSHRHCIGIEIEERYCEIAVKRLAQEMLPLL